MSFGQKSVNDYKYVTVPNSFDFLSEPDQYRLNNLTKLLFGKYGFTAFMEDETLPDDAIANVCLVLKSDVIKEKGMFNSKLRVQLKNCMGEVVYTSHLGESREKKYKVAYTLALREAFESFEYLQYEYQENPVILSYGNPEVNSNNEEIEKLKEEISQLKEEKAKLGVEAQTNSQMPLSDPVEDQEEVLPEPLEKEVLIAKGIFNGYELLDNASNVVMTIYISGLQDVFIVKGKDAIIYKKDNIWIYSETKENNLMAQAIEIKF